MAGIVWLFGLVSILDGIPFFGIPHPVTLVILAGAVRDLVKNPGEPTLVLVARIPRATLARRHVVQICQETAFCVDDFEDAILGLGECNIFCAFHLPPCNELKWERSSTAIFVLPKVVLSSMPT